MTSLADQTVLVTGANRGMGREYVTQLLDRGVAKVYAAARDPQTIDIVAAEDTVETRLAGPDDVRLLGIEMGAPLLLIHRLGFTADDSPVEWTRSVFRGDRFRFLARMKGPQH